jgi:hypothetical protein
MPTKVCHAAKVYSKDDDSWLGIYAYYAFGKTVTTIKNTTYGSISVAYIPCGICWPGLESSMVIIILVVGDMSPKIKKPKTDRFLKPTKPVGKLIKSTKNRFYYCK